MARQTRKTTRSETPKVDPYQRITDSIVAALEKGVAPWERPWDASIGMPRNGHSGYVYNGLNVLMCWAAGYQDPRWFTFNQVKEYGTSHVRKGEKGTHIMKWLFLDKEEQNETTGETRSRRVPVLRTYVVFNFEQIEWDAENLPKALVKNEIDADAACVEAATLLKKSGAVVQHGGSRAAYSPALDYIMMPTPGAFTDAAAYWSVAMHELTHWTGHSTRCDRNLTGRFGSESYAAEELVAELGSAFLSAEFGLSGKLQHPEYIGNWIKVLKGDKYALFTAAKLAREAVAFLKGEVETEEQEESVNEDAAEVACAA